MGKILRLERFEIPIADTSASRLRDTDSWSHLLPVQQPHRYFLDLGSTNHRSHAQLLWRQPQQAKTFRQGFPTVDGILVPRDGLGVPGVLHRVQKNRQRACAEYGCGHGLELWSDTCARAVGAGCAGVHVGLET